MRIVVKKYGGSSIATSEAMLTVARDIVKEKRREEGVVVVVSARGDTTNRLAELAGEITPNPSRRELDILLASGEQVAMSLLSMALQNLGADAISLTGSECGIITNNVHTNARILEVRPERIREELARGNIVVAAGFQGVSREGEVTTLGRGASDTTAVALAAALGADHCEISTDVDGVFTADPRIVPQAHRLSELSHSQIEELAWHGAQVLKAEAVELARDNGVTINVRSTFKRDHGTMIRSVDTRENGFKPQRARYTGVARRQDLVRIAIHNAGLDAGLLPLRQLFDELARYDLVFGNLNTAGTSSILYLSTKEIPDVAAFKDEVRDRFPDRLEILDGLGAASITGFGLGSRPHDLFHSLRVIQEAGIPVIESFTSRESLSFVVANTEVDPAARILHHVFLERANAENSLEEVVHADH